MKYIKPAFRRSASVSGLGRRRVARAGAKGKRFALPHARVLLHQPWGGVGGQASDIEIQAREILRMKDM